MKSKGTRLGGIVGIFVGEKIKDCTNFGDVYGEEQSVGGIAGRFTGKKIEDCVNDGKITGGIEKGSSYRAPYGVCNGKLSFAGLDEMEVGIKGSQWL